MLTDYRYRKARKLVKSARVSNGVKELFFCGLRQYKKGTRPSTCMWQQITKGKVKRACIAGAALANHMEFNGGGEGKDDNWEYLASKEFGIKMSTVDSIVHGFDSGFSDSLCNRVEVLASKVAIIIGAKFD